MTYQCHCCNCRHCCRTLRGRWFLLPWTSAPLKNRSHSGHSSPEPLRSGGSFLGTWNIRSQGHQTGWLIIWLNPASSITSHPSGKQWAAVRTQHAEIRLPPQRKTSSLPLLRQKMAATHGWDSTVVTVPPTIFICLLLVRRPQVEPMAARQKQVECSSEGEGSKYVRWGCYLAVGQLVWAEVGLETRH